jgi:pyruvate/2-oxoacid:ferredoxin oxidoreductase beta subunit
MQINVLVLDTEVYSNTVHESDEFCVMTTAAQGGQKSKATPLAAAAKFALSGNRRSARAEP